VSTGLLWVLSEPGAVDEIEFHDWYDHEHVPLRTALDGVHTARRFRAIDGEAPGWGAIYDIDLDVLRRPEYTRLRERRSPREQRVVDRLATLDRRTYELVADDGEPVEAPAVLVTTSLTVPAALEPELLSWYAEEHVPLLHAIPGWTRTRRHGTALARATRTDPRRRTRDDGVPAGDQHTQTRTTDGRGHRARTSGLDYPPSLLKGPRG
jgi:hypothetical protein